MRVHARSSRSCSLCFRLPINGHCTGVAAALLRSFFICVKWIKAVPLIIFVTSIAHAVGQLSIGDADVAFFRGACKLMRAVCMRTRFGGGALLYGCGLYGGATLRWANFGGEIAARCWAVDWWFGVRTLGARQLPLMAAAPHPRHCCSCPPAPI